MTAAATTSRLVSVFRIGSPRTLEARCRVLPAGGGEDLRLHRPLHRSGRQQHPPAVLSVSRADVSGHATLVDLPELGRSSKAVFAASRSRSRPGRWMPRPWSPATLSASVRAVFTAHDSRGERRRNGCASDGLTDVRGQRPRPPSGMRGDGTGLALDPPGKGLTT